ncbi:VOC family protein [Streptomyces sp. LX-29]|uniref:bleomycin resistance protein n=1 Tax=Streptomyces sp. LX-29 TaxID=2900152 RepID=UPI00240E4A91|nr:VOC family protein [Streptomyces sp. LX-29]WFB08161.1 VOC family protein [Streptomyces sp. LX-29]
MAETVIPMLPCRSIDDITAFYPALGFEVTFQQRSPNPYVALARGDIALHFFGMKSYDPASSYSTCYVRTDDVDALYEAFRSGLKASLGRIPTRGLPRLGALKDTTYGMRQFLLTDPGGNTLRVGQPIADVFEHRPAPTERYARALHQATLLGESKGDPAAAARVLDRALSAEGAPPPSRLAPLLVLRAEMATRLGDADHARDCLARAAAVPLTPEQRVALQDILRRADDLREHPAS